MNERIPHLVLGLALLAGCGGGGGGDGTNPPPPPPPPPESVQTVAYDIGDFRRLNINGSFFTTVRRADDYRVEITIDADEAGKLDVARNGEQLDVGFLPGSDVRASTLQAVIEMPELHGIDLSGSNHVEVTGFDAGAHEIASNGDSFLLYRDCRLDFVTADVFGSALIELVDVAAIPAAHIDMYGSSTVIVNLMDAATVTGSLMGTSALSYYGSNVTFQMNVAGSATVARLGGSR